MMVADSSSESYHKFSKSILYAMNKEFQPSEVLKVFSDEQTSELIIEADCREPDSHCEPYR